MTGYDTDEGVDEALDAIFDEALGAKLGLAEKATWVPYTGPQGGEGWKNTETGDVTYDEEPPGQALDEDQAREEARDAVEREVSQNPDGDLAQELSDATGIPVDDSSALADQAVESAEVNEVAQLVEGLGAGGEDAADQANDGPDMVAAEETLADAGVPFDYNDEGLSAAAGATDGLDEETIAGMRDAGYEPVSVDGSGSRADVQFSDENAAGSSEPDMVAAEEALAESGQAFDYVDDGAIKTHGDYSDGMEADDVAAMREAGYEMASVDGNGGIRFEKADSDGGLGQKLDVAIDDVLLMKGISFKGGWIPYQGPRGGEGWKNTDSGDVTYDDEPPGEISDDAVDQMEGAVANRLQQASDENLEQAYEEMVGGEPSGSMDETEMAQEIVDEIDEHQLAGLAQDMGAEPGAAAGSSGAIETDGSTMADSVSEGDKIVIDDTEAEVGTVSDMGGGYYIAARDDEDEVHTARVGPDHEFEIPAEGGAGVDDGPDYDPEAEATRARKALQEHATMTDEELAEVVNEAFQDDDPQRLVDLADSLVDGYEPGGEMPESAGGENTEGLGLDGDYTYHAQFDGPGSRAEPTGDGGVNLRLGWNDANEMAQMAGYAADELERRGDDDAAQALGDLQSDIKGGLPTRPSTGDPYDPEDIEVDAQDLEVAANNIGLAADYMRRQNFPEDDLEDVRYVQTRTENAIGSAQERAQDGPSQKAFDPGPLLGEIRAAFDEDAGPFGGDSQ